MARLKSMGPVNYEKMDDLLRRRGEPGIENSRQIAKIMGCHETTVSRRAKGKDLNRGYKLRSPDKVSYIDVAERNNFSYKDHLEATLKRIYNHNPEVQAAYPSVEAWQRGISIGDERFLRDLRLR